MSHRIATVVLAVLVLSSCQTAARKKQVEQQIVPPSQESVFAGQLDKNLSRAYGSWSDDEISSFFSGMVAKLMAADPAYSEAALGAVRVHLLAAGIPYAAPGLGNVIYVSRGLLKVTEFDNELAFVLATQLILLKDKAAARNLAALQGQEFGESLITLPTAPPLLQRDYLERDWFEPGGLFDFGGDTYLKAEAEAIRLAYAAKFDPRGAVSFIQRWNGLPYQVTMEALGKILPEPGDRLKSARDEVAKLSPLRDPVVRTPAFEKILSRLQVKKANARNRQG